MKIYDLIEQLRRYDPEMEVAVPLWSEYVQLEEVKVMGMQPSREDGWIHRERSDKPKQLYLVIGA